MSKDLRTWIERLETEGEFRRVKAEVKCGGEVQEIGRQMSARQGPAVLFENIEGYKDTWCTKLFIGSLNTFGKVALALGLPSDSSLKAIIERSMETWRNPISPVIVDTKDAPVKQNMITGADIDITKIPVPQWHPRDVGRYINTWVAVVTNDPETGEVNVGTYRGAIADKNTIVSYLIESQHWGQHFQKWRARGEDMPVAFIYGWDPAMLYVSGSPWNHVQGRSEWEWCGAIRGEPVPLVKCETIDLYVPATAEIVIEGHVLIDPETYVQEAPLKEISGGYAPPTKKPVTKVSCIIYRDDPIYTGSAIGTAPVLEEQIIAFATGAMVALRIGLEDAGVPGVLGLTVTPIPAVKIRKMYQGHAYQVGCALFGHKASDLPWKMWVVVEENVDIYDVRSVMGAINNNVDPESDIYIFRTHRGIVDASLGEDSLNAEEYGTVLSTKCLVDATVNWIRHVRNPMWGGARVAPAEPPPIEDIEKVQRRWVEYGLN